MVAEEPEDEPLEAKPTLEPSADQLDFFGSCEAPFGGRDRGARRPAGRAQALPGAGEPDLDQGAGLGAAVLGPGPSSTYRGGFIGGIGLICESPGSG